MWEDLITPNTALRNTFFKGATVLGLVTCLADCPAFGQEKGWKIVQDDKLFGRTTSFISKTGLLRQFPQMGGATVTLKPEWKIVFFSDATKLCCPMTMDTWRKRISSATIGLHATVPDSLLKQTWTGGVKGLKATAYRFFAQRSDGGQTKSFNCAQVVNVVLANDIELPLPVAKISCDCYCLPFTRKLPLEIEHIYNNSKGPGKIVSTFEVSPMPSDAGIICYPVGYKQVKSDLEVATGGMIDDILKEVVPSMGSSAEHSKKGKL